MYTVIRNKSDRATTMVVTTKLKSGSTLFGINSSGIIFALDTDNKYWTPLSYLGITFKKLACSKNVLWALGQDQQIYICVYDVQGPICVQEETYENQRWIFSANEGKFCLVVAMFFR